MPVEDYFFYIMNAFTDTFYEYYIRNKIVFDRRVDTNMLKLRLVY